MDGAYTVKELSEALQLALGTWFPSEIWVEGEVADLSRSAAGHAYFQLVEPGNDTNGDRACISVVLLDSARQHVNAVLRRAGGAVRMVDGTRIRIRGRIELYPNRGHLQLRMSGIDPTYTLGLLSTERDRVLRSLADDGLVDRNAGLPFPSLPLRVGVVTRHGSAAFADFVHELSTTSYAWQVVVADTPVQGPEADRLIVRGMQSLVSRGVQVVALVRGGGARTDLATFDSELLARAIAELAVPVVTGIGHEIDSSVADVVAHRSHKTPTACAAALVSDVAAAVVRAESTWASIAELTASRCRVEGARLDGRSVTLARSARRRLESDERALAGRRHQVVREATHAAARARLLLTRQVGRMEGAARRHLAIERSRLQGTTPELVARARRALARRDEWVDGAAHRVHGLDPTRLMERGWSLARTADGTVVRRAASVRAGEEIVTVLIDGKVHSQVTQVSDDVPAEAGGEG